MLVKNVSGEMGIRYGGRIVREQLAYGSVCLPSRPFPDGKEGKSPLVPNRRVVTKSRSGII